MARVLADGIPFCALLTRVSACTLTDAGHILGGRFLASGDNFCVMWLGMLVVCQETRLIHLC